MVTSIHKTQLLYKAPDPLTKTGLLRLAAKKLRFSPDIVLSIGERLYKKGLICWSTVPVPPIDSVPPVQDTRQRYFVFPTAHCVESDLQQDDYQVYSLISSLFTASVGEPAHITKTEVQISVGGEFFTSEHYHVTQQGWL